MEMTTDQFKRDLEPYLQGRSFESWCEDFDARGYVVFERVLASGVVEDLRAALAPFLQKTGRNDFEGTMSNRAYALLAKSPLFADLVIHPLALTFAEAELGPTCLLSACVAINLNPGETAQSWHCDDGSIKAPRPRPKPAYGLTAFWTLDDTTTSNGATEVIPGSHHWPDAPDGAGETPSGAEVVKLTAPAGSLAIAKGALWHRGGANKSDKSRLIVTPQYCVGWARQIETMVLAIAPETVARLPMRVRELIGYSIHPPFMGYVDGMHPRRLLTAREGAGEA
jgi:ectoine hydroxylase-related dioxygenase (phytanoyl-CoA dioxygenase family)